jgi:Spy/CpxP family protein refolding chaperone
MSKKALWILAVILLTGGIGAAAAERNGNFSQNAAWRDSPLGKLIQGQFGRILTLRSELNLTPEQRSQIRQIVQDNKQQIAQLASMIIEQRRTLRDLASDANANEKTIRQVADQMGKMIGDAAILAGQLRQKVLAVMTDEQRVLLANAQADREGAVDRWLKEIAQP